MGCKISWERIKLKWAMIILGYKWTNNVEGILEVAGITWLYRHVHLGGNWSLIEVYNNIWEFVDYGVAKMVWEPIGEKLECQVKGLNLNQ